MKARTAFAVLIASTCFSTSFVALAAPDAPSSEAVAEAGQHFTKGVSLFKEWSYDAALAEFRRAYQLAPSYRVLYNIAQVYYELHNYVDSLKAFRQYLSEGGGEISTDRKAQVDAEIRKLEGRVGYIEITANVEGVQLSLDEVPVGTLPLRAPLLVNPGLRRVTASKTGYQMTARNVTIAGGDHAQVLLEMTELPQARARGYVPPPRRTAMWIGVAATGAFAATSGVFAILANNSKKQFDATLAKYGSTKDDIDAARSKAALHAGLTDGFGAAALVAGGLTVLFALTSTGSSSSTTASAAPAALPPKRIAFAPTLGGLVAVGEF